MKKNNLSYENIKYTPFKFKLATWKNSFQNKKIKHLISIPYFFLIRVLFINKYFCSFKNLPYSIVEKINNSEILKKLIY